MHRSGSRVVAFLIFTSVMGLGTLALVGSEYLAEREPITIDWASRRQMLDGFGAASGGNVPTMTPAQLDFFYTDAGIHLTFIRLDIYPDLVDCDTNEGAGKCVKVNAGATLSAADLTNAQGAVARGAVVWAAEWSPPGPMKSNRSFMTGGAMENGPDDANFKELAEIQTSFVTLLTQTYGMPIYALSVQNEPDLSTSYPSCTWTPQQIHDYIPYLASALRKAGYGSTKLVVAEPSSWQNTYASVAMRDARVAAEIGILAAHGYRSKATPLSYDNLTGQHQWQTEVSDFDIYDGSIGSALTYATMIHDWLTVARVNSWQYWLLTGQDDFPDNEGLTDVKGNIAKRAYAFGNFSKFVRPGWSAVEVTNSTHLLVSAYRSREGDAAIVVVNNGRKAANPLFRVGAAMGAAVTPWVTSSRENLARHPSIAVSAGSFKYSIPPSSVVTFSTTQSGTGSL